MTGNHRGRCDLLLLGAVESEIFPMVSRLARVRRRSGPFGDTWEGFWGDLQVTAAVTGIGKVNAAGATACLLERWAPSLVCVVGSAGAYSGGPLRVGDVLVASEVVAGDEGVWESRGFRSMRAIGIPLAHDAGKPLFGRYPLDRSPWYRRIREITPVGAFGTFHIRYGPLLTVGMVSGDERIALERFSRYDAWAEDMEGSAVAQVCLRYGVPVLQCRGISNPAGVRDKAWWRLEEALDHCHRVLQRWLDAGLPAEETENGTEAPPSWNGRSP
ncbi:futalosine hydrolase [Desulfacinum infernum DSM 9756]|uniref:Futalosine hydrolase n=1 Tax=Desulfacinum infernum DSM 9756 TaxID=1121391 RepID=A0A1M5DNE1_9BACT|nr:futalosine hydrolase [Desulfacinum infernum]SHF68490.1 futalosine hydrolase [Desulfacinum infernum DSM 9756]